MASPTPAASATAFHIGDFDGVELRMVGSLLFVVACSSTPLLHPGDWLSFDGA
jgi:hypothetical protein